MKPIVTSWCGGNRNTGTLPWAGRARARDAENANASKRGRARPPASESGLEPALVRPGGENAGGQGHNGNSRINP